MKHSFVCEFVGGSRDGMTSRGVGSEGGGALPKEKVYGYCGKLEVYERDDTSGHLGYWIYRFKEIQETDPCEPRP